MARRDTIGAIDAFLRRPDGSWQARDKDGWFDVYDGDCLDLGDGQIMQVMGPKEIGGGSVKTAIAAVVIGISVIAAAGASGFGKGENHEPTQASKVIRADGF